MFFYYLCSILGMIVGIIIGNYGIEMIVIIFGSEIINLLL